MAWVDGCVLFDTVKLCAAGGFEVSPMLRLEHPDAHASAQAGIGVDVTTTATATAQAQLRVMRVMREYGGYGRTPSGAFRIEATGTQAERQDEAAANTYAALESHATHATFESSATHAVFDAPAARDAVDSNG